MSEKNEFLESFGKPIATYTDAEAVEDGGLVAINKKDRVTRAVFEFLVEKLPKGSKPPNCWPVDLIGWFRAANISKTEALKLIAQHGKDAQKQSERIVAERKAVAAISGLIGKHGREATRIYEQNIGGGIFKLYAPTDANGEIYELAEVGERNEIWLIPNENGALTVLFPSDY